MLTPAELLRAFGHSNHLIQALCNSIFSLTTLPRPTVNYLPLLLSFVLFIILLYKMYQVQLLCVEFLWKSHTHLAKLITNVTIFDIRTQSYNNGLKTHVSRTHETFLG